MSEPKPKRSLSEARARRRMARSMGVPLPKTLHCSFCGSSQHKVEKLIAGPRGVFICNKCVGLCEEVLAGSFTPDAKKRFEPLKWPTEDLLEMVGSVNFMADANREFLQSLVDTLRAREVSWAQIAEQLGVSRQSAWERFA